MDSKEEKPCLIPVLTIERIIANKSRPRIRLKPNLAYVYKFRGNLKNELGDNEGAIADYNEAIRLNPDFADAYYSRGNTYQNLGEKQKALDDFREASRLYQQQGKTSDYENAQNRIKKLGG